MHGIDGCSELVWLEVLPLWAVVIQDLNLQPGHPWVAFFWGANEHAAVAVGGNFVFQSKVEIRKFLLGGDPLGALFSRAGKDAILGDPVGGWALDTLPTGEVFAVEERCESFFRSAKLGNAKSCCN